MSRQDSRNELLTKAVAHVGERGMGDMSLRSLAEAIGTSHRMLIYHFGSRERLLADVLQRLRTQEQGVYLAEASRTGRAQMLGLLWKLYSSPGSEGRVRNFFYVLGLAAQQPEPYREFLDSLADWADIFREQGLREGLDEKRAANEAHLLTWSIRGLLLDLVTSGDRKRVEDAFETLRASLEQEQEQEQD
ncbi:TetR/AcrR family transcriptional regulator [Streptomyces sp. NPDC051018]|uniref:TetR/AcrR family transcriptional regulator n=1 Tax=Streptomyces sp. NPDC051018 TaxID=3365639 RepID=UPI003789D9F0